MYDPGESQEKTRSFPSPLEVGEGKFTDSYVSCFCVWDPPKSEKGTLQPRLTWGLPEFLGTARAALLRSGTDRGQGPGG